VDLTSIDNFTLLAKDYGLDEGWQASTCRIGCLLVCRYRDGEPSEQTTWAPDPKHLSERKHAFAKSDVANFPHFKTSCSRQSYTTDLEGINGGRRSIDGDSTVRGRCRPITDDVITDRDTQSHENKRQDSRQINTNGETQNVSHRCTPIS
jgi:hypothetical protein